MFPTVVTKFDAPSPVAISSNAVAELAAVNCELETDIPEPAIALKKSSILSTITSPVAPLSKKSIKSLA